MLRQLLDLLAGTQSGASNGASPFEIVLDGDVKNIKKGNLVKGGGALGVLQQFVGGGGEPSTNEAGGLESILTHDLAVPRNAAPTGLRISLRGGYLVLPISFEG